MNTVLRVLEERSTDGILPWDAQIAAAERYGWSCAAVEELALVNGLLPAHYQRNRGMLSIADQLQLFRSRIVVIGCGGLGGYVIEEFARLGVGHIVAVDPDVFEEHNLNRQLLATIGALGHPKVEAALARVNEINPAVRLTPVQAAFCKGNAHELLQGAKVAVDALDSIPCRLELAEACTTPLGHPPLLSSRSLLSGEQQRSSPVGHDFIVLVLHRNSHACHPPPQMHQFRACRQDIPQGCGSQVGDIEIGRGAGCAGRKKRLREKGDRVNEGGNQAPMGAAEVIEMAMVNGHLHHGMTGSDLPQMDIESSQHRDSVT